MSKYTPGPWEFECEDVGTYGSNFWLESKSGEEIICQGETEHDGVLIKGQDFVANARIIAAAPEMLEALERIFEIELGMSEKTESIAKKAIAKAKGEMG